MIFIEYIDYVKGFYVISVLKIFDNIIRSWLSINNYKLL